MGKADRYQKLYPVTWDQLHRDAKALAWRLLEQGPFKGIIGVARGGLDDLVDVFPAGHVRLELADAPPRFDGLKDFVHSAYLLIVSDGALPLSALYHAFPSFARVGRRVDGPARTSPMRGGLPQAGWQTEMAGRGGRRRRCPAFSAPGR